VAVGDQGRALARLVLQPPVWWLPAAAFAPLTLPAVWLLPPGLRAAFGLSWGPRREAPMRAAVAASRRLVPRLPVLLRDVPAARASSAGVRVSGLP
jgi:uncharacterized protein (DUF2236 family)